MTFNEIQTEYSRLEGKLDQRLTKYARNLMRYHGNSGARRESVWEVDGSPLGYFFASVEDDVGPAPSINVLQSMIESSVSKLAQLKVRPFLNPIAGGFNTKRVCRQGQIFFDELFDEQDVYSKARLSLRDAEICEYGVHWIDDEERKIKRVRPWEFYCDSAEYTFGDMTHCHLKFLQFPAIKLRAKIDKSKTASAAKSLFQSTPYPRAVYRIFWDLAGKEKIEFVNSEELCRSKITYTCAPFSFIWYHPPVRGFKSTSLVDAQIRTQEQIDELSDKLHSALSLTPANTAFVPKGSDVKTSMLSNRIGEIVEYNPIQGLATPVTIATPAAIHPQYVQSLEKFIQLGYEMEGISQLSASSKKPGGLSSGVALQTIEDIESERHEVIVENYKRFLMDDARIAIEVFPEDADILPNKSGRASIPWKAIKKERESFSIQFAATNFLSRDPQTKMEQIEKLISMKFITPPMASDYLDLPDQNAVDNIIGSSYQAGERTIERAITEDVYDIPPTLDYTMLFQQICTLYNVLDSQDEDRKTLERLAKLLKVCQEKIKEVEIAQNPPPPAPPPQSQLPLPKVPAPAGPLIPVEGAPAPQGGPPA